MVVLASGSTSTSAPTTSSSSTTSSSTSTTISTSLVGNSTLDDNKKKVIEHYDGISNYYFDLWGEHIHHGYWINGNESKEEAQAQLIDKLIECCSLEKRIKGSSQSNTCFRILDVGCGFGGTSQYILKRYSSCHERIKVTGISISKKQVQMATEHAVKNGFKVPDQIQFIHMDADHIQISKEGNEDEILKGLDGKVSLSQGSFDVIWVSEALSHFSHKSKFFQNANKLLKEDGILVIADWFRSNILSQEQYQHYIAPIEEGMFVPNLCSMINYQEYMNGSGFNVKHVQDISESVGKSWDIGLQLITDSKFWNLAVSMGTDFVNFLSAFQAMRNGFKSKCFVYGIVVGEKKKHLIEVTTELNALESRNMFTKSNKDKFKSLFINIIYTGFISIAAISLNEYIKRIRSK